MLLIKNEELRMKNGNCSSYEQSEMHSSWAMLKVLLSSCK
jgi:hypothetical protein